MSTIKDVAKSAGVSIATVSNYLNHTKPVSKEVSQRIKEAVDQLQYSQNISAKNLKSNSYTDIGVILPNFNDSYYVQIFQGIENFFKNTNYYLNPVFTYDIPDLEQNVVKNLQKKQICGLILISCQPDNWKFYYDHFTSAQKPLVLIDRNIHSLDANFVSFDNYAIIKGITCNLLEQGYKNIFLMSGSEQFECESNCMKGFHDALVEKDMTILSHLFLPTNLSKEDAFRKTTQLLKQNIPEAIIATSECIATGIIEGLNILGYSTKDIPVLTLGEEHWNLHTHSFANDSVPRPAMKLGYTASKLLLEQLHSPFAKESEKIFLKDVFSKNFSLSTVNAPAISTDISSQPSCIRILMLDTPQVQGLQGLVKNFEDQTGIKTQITLLPHHNLYDAITANYNAAPESAYDVVMYDIPWLSTLASDGLLYDISQELSSIDLSIFLPNCLQYFSRFNKKFYGLPFMYAPQIFYYRKDLFENSDLKSAYEKQSNMTLRPPLTLKEFNTIAAFFTNKTDAIDYGISIPAAYDECLAPEIYMRIRAYNGDLFDSKGNVSLDCPQSLQAYINFVRSIKVAKPNYRTATDISVVEEFIRGDTAMLISYPSFLTDIVDLRKSSIMGSIGYHHIPGRSPLLGGWSLGISSTSHHKENAFKFLKWTCDEQISNYIALLGGQTAIVSSYTNDELVKLNPWLPLYHSTYQYCKPTIPPKYRNRIIPQNEVDSIVCKWIYELLDEKLEIQEAITNTHIELENMIHQYKKFVNSERQPKHIF